MLSPCAARDSGFVVHEAYTILGTYFEKLKKKKEREYNTTSPKLGTGPWKGPMQN